MTISSESEEDKPLDAEDKKWHKWAVNKFVYFRWSTAHHHKNRFKGMVIGHKSRLEGGNRVDFLVIKTFGFSEDEYIMGKDIREFFVLPKKSVLLGIKSDDEARELAIKKWTYKLGWTNGPFTKFTPMSSPKQVPDIIPSSSTTTSASSSPIVKSRRKLETKKDAIVEATHVTAGIHVVGRHGENTMAARVGGFSFASGMFS